MNGYRLDLVVKFLEVQKGNVALKLKVNMLALFFLFKDIEKMSRKLYNNRDKKGGHCYGKWNIYRNKKKNTGCRRRLRFVTSDFTDIATTTTVRKCLGRQVEEKNIRRIIDGVYEKPI